MREREKSVIVCSIAQVLGIINPNRTKHEWQSHLHRRWGRLPFNPCRSPLLRLGVPRRPLHRRATMSADLFRADSITVSSEGITLDGLLLEANKISPETTVAYGGDNSAGLAITTVFHATSPLVAEEAKQAATPAEITGRKSVGVLMRTQSYRGPRIGESTALKVKELDAAGKRVRTHHTLTVDEQGARALGQVKSLHRRWLPLAKHLHSNLQSSARRATKEDSSSARHVVKQ